MLKFHPIAKVFPLIDGTEFDAFVDDIRANGLRSKIVLCEGKILDGRNRYRACGVLGIEPLVEVYEGSDPLGFVVSLNLNRRHLNESQRAMVAAEIANLQRGRPQENGSIELITQRQAADLVNSSPASIKRARQVLEQAPVLADAVKRGDIAVSRAATLVGLPEDQQKEAVRLVTSTEKADRERIGEYLRGQARARQAAYIEKKSKAAENDEPADIEISAIEGICTNPHVRLGDYREQITETADLIVTSPPYNIGSVAPAQDGLSNLHDPKSFGGMTDDPDSLPEDQYQESQVEFLHWCVEHLSPDGVLVYNHELRRRDGRIVHPMEWILKVPELTLREEVIWDRRNTHNQCRHMLSSQAERLYVMTKTGDHYILNKQGLPQPSDIWSIPREHSSEHNAPFPEALVEAIVLAWSKEGDLVIDPYSGSGTTGVVALRLRRQFIGAEIMPRYVSMANNRINALLVENAT
jgi:DNA modification methylase